MCLLTPSDQPAPVFSQQCLAGGKMTQSISSRIMEWVRLEGTLDPSRCSCCRGQGPLPLVYLSFYCCWQAPNVPSLGLLHTEFPPQGSEGGLKDKHLCLKEKQPPAHRGDPLPAGDALGLGRGLQPGSLPRVPV